MTRIHCLGLNHRTAPVELRELFSSPLVPPETILFPYLRAAASAPPAACPAHARPNRGARRDAATPPTSPRRRGNGDGRRVRAARGIPSGDGDGTPSAGGNGTGRASGCPFHGHRTSGDVLLARRISSGEVERRRRRRPHLARVGAFASIRELTFFATCNRMELYACVDKNEPDPRGRLVAFLSEAYMIDPARFEPHLYHYTAAEAAAHLCEVAAGLDSLVLGETQILGQIRGAYENALDSVTAGPTLLALYRAAIRAGKRARTETTISSNPASMSSVAIAAAQSILGDLRSRRVLVVGAGETGMLTLKVLHVREIHHVSVVNRSVERVAWLRDAWGYRVHGLDALPEALAEADAVITSTAAPEPIIDARMVRDAAAKRDGRPLVVIDIAVPRDVDPGVADVPGVHLFDTDDLRGELDRALAAREREIPKVRAIVEEETARYEQELRVLSMTPLITDLREKAEAIRRYELEKALRRLPDADPETKERIRYLTRAIVNKLLHEPTVRLKRVAQAGRADAYDAAVRDLFGLLRHPEV